MLHNWSDWPVLCITVMPADKPPARMIDRRMMVQGRRATNFAHFSKTLAIASCKEGSFAMAVSCGVVMTGDDW